MSDLTDTAPLPVVGEPGSARPGILQRIRDVWAYRELLGNLTRKELKVKYKGSFLGFAWSLLNPILYLVVFWIVFQKILGAGIPNFPIFFLAGLLPWNLFSISLGSGTTAITGNASLVGRVWFPREILVIAPIGANLVHFFLQFIVLGIALVIFRVAPSPAFMVLLPFALLTLLVLVAALGLLFAAVNVYLRDTEHLLELLLLAWFWMTPIVYPYMTVASKLKELWWVYLLNPMTSIVITFQRALYNHTTTGGGDATGVKGIATGSEIIPDASVFWYFRNLALVFLGSLALFWFASWVFGRLEGDFAEEI
ncbi:MAG: ABC transporter permease [Acidimicrobiia bacterium]